MSERSDFYRGDTARDYESLRASSSIWKREDRILDELLRVLDRPERTVVLDLPVGTGRYLDLYNDLGWVVLGLDISSEMLIQARARSSGRGAFAVSNARNLPLRSSVTDVAVCIRFAHLIDKPLLRATMQELRRALKPGGTLVIGARLHVSHGTRSAASRLKDMAQRQWRATRFMLGEANSRSYGERWFMHSLEEAGFAVIDRREVTSYDDGSRYLIVVSRAVNPAGDQSIELFGLPGVGKSTLARGLLKSDDIGIGDGFAALQPLSLRQCVRAEPVKASLFLLRLLPVARELRRPVVKHLVVGALRQLVAGAAASRTTLHEEGITHEIWRQLMAGEQLSDSLIRALTPIADVTVFLEAPRLQLKNRLGTKPSPGPISRRLLEEPIEGVLWELAEEHFDRLKRIVQSRMAHNVSTITNDDIRTGMNALTEVIARTH